MPEIVSMGEVLVEIMRPTPGVPLSQAGELRGPFPSGAPAIYIDAVSRLGGSAGFIGVVGQDAFGDLVESRLRESGVDISLLRRHQEFPTGCAFVSYEADGSRSFIFHLSRSAAGSLGLQDISPEFLGDARLLHITGSALGVSPSCREACYKAVQLVTVNGGEVSFDPNLRPELLSIEAVRAICQPILEKTTIVFPSEEEACLLTGMSDQFQSCRELLKQAQVVALKQGSRGCRIFTREGEFDVPSFPIERIRTPIDPTGAGDCFNAGFSVNWVAGKPLEECAQLGNAAGALCTTRLGPMEGTVSLAELMELRRQLLNEPAP